MSLFPADTVLLPVSSGGLVVSQSYATFCPIPSHAVALARQVISGDAQESALPTDLAAELARHGFGGPPREPKEPSPSVQIQLTNDCNLSCTYCCTNSGKARAKEVKKQSIFQAVDDIREVLGPKTRVAILGGEPFLIPWALELAEHIVNSDLSLTVFTNGTLLSDDALCQRLADLIKEGAQVRISLAGPNPTRCDAESRADRFDLVLAGVASIARHGAIPIVDLMLMPQDVDDVAESIPALRKRLPNGVRIALGVLYLSGREQGEHLFRSRGQLESALDKITFEAGETISAPAPAPVAERREGCTCALGHHLHIRSDGALFTCFKMEEQVGHLEEMSFSQALMRQAERAHPVAALPKCVDCPIANLCGGGCRSENLQFTGDPNVPVCDDWRLQVLAELLAEDRVTALEWPATHLLAEAHARGIHAPQALIPVVESRHLRDT